jgi:hypothetical protein
MEKKGWLKEKKREKQIEKEKAIQIHRPEGVSGLDRQRR